MLPLFEVVELSILTFESTSFKTEYNEWLTYFHILFYIHIERLRVCLFVRHGFFQSGISTVL